MLKKLLMRFKPKLTEDLVAGISIDANSICLVVRQSRSTEPSTTADCIARQASFENVDQLISTLKLWVTDLSLNGARIVLTLDPADYQLFQMEKPDVDAPDLRSAVHWKLQDYLDYPVAESICDIFEVPEGRHGHSQQIYVAVAKKQRLKELIHVVQSAGLAVYSINIAQLAIRSLVANEQLNESVGIVYLSDQTSQLFICKGDTFFLTRNINLGRHQINEYDESSRLEITDQFSLEIQRTMDYYDSHYDQSPIRKLIFLDRTSETNWLSSSVADMLGLSLYQIEQPDANHLESSDLLPIAYGGLLEGLEQR